MQQYRRSRVDVVVDCVGGFDEDAVRQWVMEEDGSVCISGELRQLNLEQRCRERDARLLRELGR